MPRSASQRIDRINDFQHSGVNLHPDWAGVFQHDPVSPILMSNHPGAILLALQVLPRGEQLPVQELKRTFRRMAGYQPQVLELLAKQRPDGTWPSALGNLSAEPGEQMKLAQLLENLTTLKFWGAKREWSEVERGLRAVMALQRKDGRFPVPYHHHSALGALLISFGLTRNPVVHKAAHWIAGRQRDDGGWLYPRLVKGKGDGQSCIWTTVEVLNFIARYPTANIRPRLAPAGEFLLAHALEPNVTQLLPGADTWNRLAIGSKGESLFYGGTLKALEALSQAGFNPAHSGFKKLYKWLLTQQLSNGLFPGHAGRDERGAVYVTARVLDLVRRVETTRPGSDPAKTTDSAE